MARCRRHHTTWLIIDLTWLTTSDLVFIDPVGTGYSRAARPELASRFFGLAGDIDSVGEFIRMYLTRYERWTSPLFLAGESYGTTRASALSGVSDSTAALL
jgi:carboxypeptidase C (cathepsin A)